MQSFYVLQFGKHLSRFFSHCFIKQEGNFYEYALHHGLSTFLIIFSYLMNMWLIGIFILVIHDLSDLFLILARAYRVHIYLFRIIETTAKNFYKLFMFLQQFHGLDAE